MADKLIAETDTTDAEWLIVPGGMPGATNLAACDALNDDLQKHWLKQGKIASICASPAVVLAPLDIIRGQNATCYPSFKADLEKGGATYVDMRVVESGNLITSNGPSSAFCIRFCDCSRQSGRGCGLVGGLGNACVISLDIPYDMGVVSLRILRSFVLSRKGFVLE